MNKNELVEIKKDKTGTGLLIENDGYISLDEGNNKIIKEGIEEDGWHVPNPFIVDAVFQKYGIKNANGRIYPEEVLKKQVELYQQRIAEHRAYGECYKPDVLILTENGWKKLREVTVGENILTLNTKTNEIEIKPILRVIEKDFDGELINLKGRNIDESVTPNHKFPIYNIDNIFDKFMTASEIVDIDKTDVYIPFSKENLSEGIYLDKRFLNLSKEQYNGKVMCVEVENHTWYVMSNGKAHWTGNCNHPAESTIDLGRISHNIIELHWEGRTLVGKMELNISEGFRRNGICSTLGDTVANLLLNGYKIGVSSRGVGSVENKLGSYIVSSDYQLLAWDVVSDPSTNNAYISVNGKEELTPYLEDKQNDKPIINEKIKKLKNILNN